MRFLESVTGFNPLSSSGKFYLYLKGSIRSYGYTWIINASLNRMKRSWLYRPLNRWSSSVDLWYFFSFGRCSLKCIESCMKKKFNWIEICSVATRMNKSKILFKLCWFSNSTNRFSRIKLATLYMLYMCVKINCSALRYVHDTKIFFEILCTTDVCLSALSTVLSFVCTKLLLLLKDCYSQD